MIKKILLLGSGELGKEFVIACKRLGNYVVAVDSYEGAPAMQVADEYEVIDMLNDWYGERLEKAAKNFENYIMTATEPIHILPAMYNMVEIAYSIICSECVDDKFKDHAWAVEHAAKYITKVAVIMGDDFDGNQEELVKNFRKEIVEYEKFTRR